MQNLSVADSERIILVIAAKIEAASKEPGVAAAQDERDSNKSLNMLSVLALLSKRLSAPPLGKKLRISSSCQNPLRNHDKQQLLTQLLRATLPLAARAQFDELPRALARDEEERWGGAEKAALAHELLCEVARAEQNMETLIMRDESLEPEDRSASLRTARTAVTRRQRQIREMLTKAGSPPSAEIVREALGPWNIEKSMALVMIGANEKQQRAALAAAALEAGRAVPRARHIERCLVDGFVIRHTKCTATESRNEAWRTQRNCGSAIHNCGAGQVSLAALPIGPRCRSGVGGTVSAASDSWTPEALVCSGELVEGAKISYNREDPSFGGHALECLGCVCAPVRAHQIGVRRQAALEFLESRAIASRRQFSGRSRFLGVRCPQRGQVRILGERRLLFTAGDEARGLAEYRDDTPGCHQH
jgi:hypothetical protein